MIIALLVGAKSTSPNMEDRCGHVFRYAASSLFFLSLVSRVQPTLPKGQCILGEGKTRNEVNGCIVLANFLNALTMYITKAQLICSRLIYGN